MESLIQIFSSEVMHALSWTIMHSIWQGLIIAIVLALFIKLTPRLRANTKYVISCIAMLLLFTLSAITFYSYYELEGTYAAFETVLSSNLNNTIQAISIENSRALFNAENLISNNSQIISLLWFFGLLFFFSRMIFGFLKIQRLKRDTLPLANAWNEILENLKAKANYTGNVFLGESTRVVTPLTFGVIKSVLLFPVGMITQLSHKK